MLVEKSSRRGPRLAIVSMSRVVTGRDRQGLRDYEGRSINSRMAPTFGYLFRERLACPSCSSRGNRRWFEILYENTRCVYMFRNVYTFSKPLAWLNSLPDKAFRALWLQSMGLMVTADGGNGLWIWENGTLQWEEKSLDMGSR